MTVSRLYSSYSLNRDRLRDEAQPHDSAIGRRLLLPEEAGLLSQWGRERPPSASAFGVPAPSRGVAHAPTAYTTPTIRAAQDAARRVARTRAWIGVTHCDRKQSRR